MVVYAIKGQLSDDLMRDLTLVYGPSPLDLTWTSPHTRATRARKARTAHGTAQNAGAGHRKKSKLKPHPASATI